MEKQLECIASSVFTGERRVDFNRLIIRFLTLRVDRNEHKGLFLKIILLRDLTCEPDLPSFINRESIRFIIGAHTTIIFCAKNF